jgi:hypothetical protein
MRMHMYIYVYILHAHIHIYTTRTHTGGRWVHTDVLYHITPYTKWDNTGTVRVECRCE